MNKKNLLKSIVIGILVFIGVIFIVYKIDSINRIEEKILDHTEWLMESISIQRYDEIKKYLKNIDDTELSNQVIYNFLLNTGLYRIIYINEENPEFQAEVSVNFWNTNKGKLYLSFEALNGDLINIELEYMKLGTEIYFITDDIQKSDKEIKQYPLEKDLANGKEVTYSGNNDNDNEFTEYQFIQDENGNLYVQIIEEAKEDIKIAMINSIKEKLSDSDKYTYNWNEDCSIISVYYNSTDELSFTKKLYIQTVSMLSSVTLQALNKNPDWHLTINYYDYNTKELLNYEIIR